MKERSEGLLITIINTLFTSDDYEPLVGAEAVDRVHEKAKPLQDLYLVHINSTYYGGGVAEMLGLLTLLMDSVGIKTGWRVIQGSPDFSSVTKKIHIALQGCFTQSRRHHSTTLSCFSSYYG